MLKPVFSISFMFLFPEHDIHLRQLVFTSVVMMLTAATVCFVASEITGNYSQVDKLWSIMPVIYSILSLSVFPTPRILIMSMLITIWGARLSFNFYRKGGYNIIPWKGEEDYRWKILRQHPTLKGRIRFGLFNLFFISFYQHFLLLLISSPLLIAVQYRQKELSLADLAVGLLILTFILLETISDNQLYSFQKQKRDPGKPEGCYAESVKNGFLSEGLWRFVRHPNYTSEQAVWISFYLFGVTASGNWINWTITGPLLLVVLFMGSTRLTERISIEKYPSYADYMKKVPKFLPRFRRN